MKQKYKVALLIVINIILLNIISLFTSSGAGGGNGNPALIPLILFIPFVLWNARELYKWSRKFNISTFFKGSFSLFFFVYIALGVNYQIKLYKEIPQNIKDAKLARGIPIDDQYIESVTTGLTYFTNTVYFNYNTFLMFLCFIIFLAITIPSKQKTSWSK